jgi:hypothetical protein
MTAKNNFTLALAAVVGVLGGCVSAGSSNSTAADRDTAECQRSSASNQECDKAKAAESAAATPATPH